MEKKVYNQNQLEKIHFLQRLIRSFYVRRQFEHVRKEYLQTLSEIEGEPIVEKEDKPAPGNWKNVSRRTIEPRASSSSDRPRRRSTHARRIVTETR